MAKVMVNAATYSAQRGGGIHKWVNDKALTGEAQTLTDATMYYDIDVGEVVMIMALLSDMETASSDCHFHMITCTAVAGGGDATDISGHVHVFTGTAFSGSESKERPFDPPIRVVGSATVKSITVQVLGTAEAVVSCGWTGYTDLSLA